MVSANVYPYAAAAFVLLASVAVLRRRPKQEKEQQPRVIEPYPLAGMPIEKLPRHIQNLLAELRECVILQSDVEVFQDALDGSWAQPNREIIPACIVRPNTTQQLSQAVSILKREYDDRSKSSSPAKGLFSVRSGGLNPGLGVAGFQDGVVIDLSRFSEVTPSADRSTVTLGAGAKWIDVHKKLEDMGLAVMGGRSSPAGVGGLILQGGMSFYSGRFGFVCSNVLSYEVVLADGSIVTASAKENPDLWRVLKGGGNNFGIVTRFTLPTLPAAPLWFMQMIAPASFQQDTAMRAYHDFLANAGSDRPGAFDEEACAPIMNFAHINGLPIHILAVQLAYTKAPNDQLWPAYWRDTNFSSIWSFTKKGEVQNQTKAVEANGKYAPPGTRHTQGSTTIRNDLETMKAAYGIFCENMTRLKDVKGLNANLIFQAILPGWFNKGDPNILGLQNCSEPLIIVSSSTTWSEAKDDQRVRGAIQRMLEQIEAVAATKQTGHPYRFINYCMEWQRPYDGMGEENLTLVKEASGKYDPERLFQTGCVGGFKLPPI